MIPIISDTHFGAKNFAKSVFGMQMLFFEKQFFPYLLKNNVKDVLHAGDLFHNRNIIDLYILQELKKRFFGWFEEHGINLHLIVGNHDSYFKNSIEHNGLTYNTKEFQHTLVYDTPTTIKLDKYTIGMVPWVTDDDCPNLPMNVDILVGHFDIKSFAIMKGVYSSEGYDLDFFRDYKMVISGHYHIRGSKDNVHFVGNPYQQSWGDFEIDKGFYVLNDDFKLKWHENTVTPRHVKMYYNDSTGTPTVTIRGEKGDKVRQTNIADAVTCASKNYVKIMTEKVLDQAQFDSFYNSMQMRSRDGYKIELIDANEVIESFDFEEIEERIREESDTFSTIHAFISGMTFEPGIDSGMLMDLMRDLYKEAEEMQNTIQVQRNQE